MARTLAQVQAQIEKLQQQAERLRQKEKAQVIGRIREAIVHYGITATELGFEGRSRSTGSARPTGRKARASGKGVVKYRDSEGNTWTGHGKRPNWFKAALAAGKTPEDLLA